jgi:hypothetical protein
MTPSEIDALFAPFYNSFVNLAELTNAQRPLHMAHYTTLATLEKIIKTNELWFSNPLFMNDLQEMRWGVQTGQNVFREVATEPDIIALAGSDARMNLISNAFYHYFQTFDREHAFDVYVFCFSEHDPVKHPDGLLSMWRGYGGNGHGAALVFNTSFITVIPESPLLIAKVNYATEAERVDWLKDTFRRCFSGLRQHGVTDADLHVVGYQMFYLMMIYSILSKHPGFREEQEWRVIYLPFRDQKGLFKEQLHYVMGQDAIEPKLRFPIEPLKLEPRETWTFDSILETILLGPTHQSPLAELSIKRMFQTLKKPEFIPKLKFSGIPLRPTR